MINLWTVRDRGGERLKRGDWVMLDNELAKLTYVTPRKIIIRQNGGLRELRPQPYKGRISNIVKVHDGITIWKGAPYGG